MDRSKADLTGVAFSGGGVRSAAFCSGVLRRLLQKRVTIDYLSSVSGGGFTAASYMDWKYRNGKKDDPAWHKEYFEHFRKHINALCDCYVNPLKGIIDGLVIFAIVFGVSVILTSINAFAFSIPTAYIIDFFFGEILRTTYDCFDKDSNSSNSTNCNSLISNPKVDKVYALLLILFAVFLSFYFLSSLTWRRKAQYFFQLFRNLSALIFCLVFVPWAIETYTHSVPQWTLLINVPFLTIAAVMLITFPSAREKVLAVLVLYLYSYIVMWKVFRETVWGIEYTAETFWIAVWISGVLVWIHPFLAQIRLNVSHQYSKYRLGRTYFSPESSARTSCITCRDILRWLCCFSPPEEHVSNRPLTLADLMDTQPEYTCNVTVNNWRKTGAEGEVDFEVLTISPKAIQRLDHQSDEKEFDAEGFVKPRDLKLSTAMATSAAVLSYELGGIQGSNKPFRQMRILLGLSLGTSIVTQPELTMDWCSKIFPLIVQLFLGISTTFIPILRYFENDLETGMVWETIGTMIFACLVLVLILIAVIPTGSQHPGLIERFARWCIINIYHVRLIRQLIGVTNTGPTPPPVMSLSDGGHVENLGLLALLKHRLPRIVVVNGGAVENGDNYASDLLRTLDQARQKLQCSFTGVSGRDILEDVRAEFVEKPPGNKPRSYRFKVTYYEQCGPNIGKAVGEGEVLMLMPRHPDDGMNQFQDCKWSDFDGDVKLDLDESVWGPGPALRTSEVDFLSGCCCECCHVKLPFDTFNGFPFHSTANQMFTATQFTAYHREGYHACLEAEAAEFLMNGPKKSNVVTAEPQLPELRNVSTVVLVESLISKF